MGLTRVVTLRKKGQLTIPDDVRAELGLGEGDPLWLAMDGDVLTLTPRPPRPTGLIAEAVAPYTVDARRSTAPPPETPGRLPPAPRLSEILAMFAANPMLTADEADAFARDLAEIRAEGNRGEVRDPWES
jgi:AbrB family looped-hinge helix DNA binding protein